jgi:hypothetical protein
VAAGNIFARELVASTETVSNGAKQLLTFVRLKILSRAEQESLCIEPSSC